MLQHEAALEQIKRTRLVAILRGRGSGQALDIASALYEGGVGALEFLPSTMTIPIVWRTTASVFMRYGAVSRRICWWDAVQR